MSNRNLIIVFVLLLGLFLANKFFRGNTNSNFDKTFSALQKENISEIVVYNKSETPTFTLSKKNEVWVGRKNDRIYKLNQDRISGFIGALSNIEIQRLATKSSEKWDNYEVGESSGNRIVVKNNGNIVLDFIVGRFSFDQQTRTATSYLRRTTEDEVYAMDGFASMTLNQDFDGLRYNKLLELQKTDIETIEIQEEGNTYALMSDNGYWKNSTGMNLDSTAVADYLTSLENLSSSSFAVRAGNDAVASVDIRLKDGQQKSIQITRMDNKFVLSSAEEAQTYVESDSSGLVNTLLFDFKELVASPSDM